ncbi:uncharacterized protein LOC133173934 [Saccostrea echinata]|uniref:uncharacterized protein LOC133173934 n=1 Tax=Saccostrea echinata TaxID=191078 RepID=UPI002A82B7A9|nr:uncharacterized protein LOC133173934 [Saccostrea echinata]
MACSTFVKETMERCGICNKGYTEPRMLPCFDSFCNKCLKIYIEEHKHNGIFQCPLCNERISIPSNGEFEPNFHLTAKQSVLSAFQRPNCDICEDVQPAINRCIECEQNLCTKCSKIHLKIKSTHDHHLADMSDPEGRVFLTSKAFCLKHQSEEMSFYCNECYLPICIRCRLTSHNTHNTSDLADVAVQSRDELKSLFKLAESGLVDLKEQQNEFSVYKLEVKKIKFDITERITSQTQRIHKLVDQVSKQLAGFVEDEISEEDSYIDKKLTMLDKAIKSNKARLKVADQIIECGSDNEIVQAKEALMTCLKNIPLKPNTKFRPNKLNIEYIPSVLADEDLEGLFGMLASRVGTPGYISLLEVNSFRVDDADDVINSICPIQNGEAWVTYGWTSNLYVVNRAGEKVKTFSLGSDIDFITKDKYENIYISCRNEKCIRKLNPEMNIIETVLLDSYPRGIAMTPQGHLVVCCPQSKTYFEYVSSHVNTVSVLSYDGDKVTVFGERGDMFLYPIRVAISESGDFIVSDNLNHSVIIFNNTGKIHAIYYGQQEPTGHSATRPISTSTGHSTYLIADDSKSRGPLSALQRSTIRTATAQSRESGLGSASMMRPFDPRGITYDSFGHVIVTDYSSNSIHLLDHSGRFLRLLLSEKDGIFAPTSVAVDENGYLWIGGGNATIKVYSYIKA